jgi:hypothetical protein
MMAAYLPILIGYVLIVPFSLYALSIAVADQSWGLAIFNALVVVFAVKEIGAIVWRLLTWRLRKRP